MIQFNHLLEKLGMDQFDNKSNTSKFAFDDVTDAQVKKELLLIQQVQLYKDFFAEEQLISKYRGLISNLVNSSRAKNITGYDAAYQLAVGSLKSAIRNYNLKMYNTAKPNTYITNNIKFDLDKLYKSETSQNTIQMSADLNRYKNNISNAESMLIPKLGRKPTDKELLDFIQKDMGFGPSLDLKKIERIKHYSTKELSGSTQIGQENAGGAEALTFEDVMNGTESIDDILTASSKEQQVIEKIREFTENKNERRFLMAYLGIGEFKQSKLKGLALKAAIENGLSYYFADKILDKFRGFCAEKGLV